MTKPKNMTPEQEAAWREKNREKNKLYSRIYEEKNPDKVKEKNKKYRSKNSSRYRKKQWIDNNPDKKSEYKKRYNSKPESKEKIRKYKRFISAKKRAERGVEYEWFMASLMAEAEAAENDRGHDNQSLDGS